MARKVFNMKENLILANYKVEIEAYQALSELKRDMSNANYLIYQGVIVKRKMVSSTSWMDSSTARRQAKIP